MKRTLILMLTGILPFSANALESSVSGSPQAAQSAVTSIDSKLDSSLAALQAQLSGMQHCEALGDFYAPGHAGADANGCWSNSVTIAAKTIVAFNGTTCPTGWAEYTPARGKFLRGIDNGAGYDPGGTRAPGSYQADLVGSHSHSFSYWAAAWGDGAYGTSQISGNPSGFTTTSTAAAGGAETRPRNVAVLFCQKS